MIVMRFSPRERTIKETGVLREESGGKEGAWRKEERRWRGGRGRSGVGTLVYVL